MSVIAHNLHSTASSLLSMHADGRGLLQTIFSINTDHYNFSTQFINRYFHGGLSNGMISISLNFSWTSGCKCWLL